VVVAADRPRRTTLWLTLAIVGTLTLGLTVELVHLRIGVPPQDSTQIEELARVATAPPVFAAFQLATALLLSAARSSFQAGPVLLNALARQRYSHGRSAGILPAWLGRTNSRYTPYWGAVVFLVAAARWSWLRADVTRHSSCSTPRRYSSRSTLAWSPCVGFPGSSGGSALLQSIWQVLAPSVSPS
jgi:hypothetical protein